MSDEVLQNAYQIEPVRLLHEEHKLLEGPGHAAWSWKPYNKRPATLLGIW